MFLLFWYSFIIAVFCVSSSPNIKFHGSGLEANAAVGYHKEPCGAVEPVVLSEILGPAFNSRYMSIEKPPDKQESTRKRPDNIKTTKRRVQEIPSFYVDGNYAFDLGDEPAWEVKYAELNNLRSVYPEAPPSNKTRKKRHTFDVLDRPWECESKIKWIDLGNDYFPRFLRTVDCKKHDCWYGFYACQPRSFTVKILRRRNGTCVKSDPMKKIGISGLPAELRELWVWEERAVNFCCDCMSKY